MRFRIAAPVVCALLTLAPAARADLTVEREFRYADRQIRVSTRGGVTAVRLAGAMREDAAGRPDLPWLSERVDLPPGMKVTAVTVTGLATSLLAADVHLPAAAIPAHGVGAPARSQPDPRWFAGAAFQPDPLVQLGVQGDLRGRNVAYLRVSPTRWNPATGRLERVDRVQVRLTLADGAAPAVPRERIVKEWEDGGLPTGIPTRAVTTLAASAVGKPGAAPFKPEQLPSVLGSPVEYVIVTNDAMAPVFQQLADWKTQTGVPAVVRTLSFIQQQYPYGADDAERIRSFIRDAYSRWGTKWVLLGGDTGVLPTRYATTTFFGGENIATDLYFQCLDGNWNADGDSLYGEGFLDSSDPGDDADLLPDLYVGRAPVTTPGDAQTFVNKTLQYEKTPVGGYENTWLLFAEILFPQPYVNGDPIQQDGAAIAEQLLPIADENPAIRVTRLYQNYADTTYQPGALPLTKQAVLDSMSVGYGLVLHVGHGFRNVMQVTDGNIVNGDASGLTNGARLFNLYAIDCTSNAIDFPCLGEAFVQNPNGGAVTNVGSTRLDFPNTGESYQQEYFRLFVEDSVSAVGELEARQKLPFVPFSSYDSVNRWTQMTLLLLGDPELRMWNGRWRALAVTNPATVSLADTQFTVHVTTGGQPLANAQVTAYRPGDEYRTATTNANGDAVVPFFPDSTGAFTLTVTAYNARPYQATMTIVPTSQPSVSEAAVSVDDDNLGGTSGNGDHQVDAGEVVDLNVAVRNRGGATSGPMTAVLSAADSFVTVTGAAASYGALAPGATGNPSPAFRISVPAATPDQREVAFTLTLNDGAHRWVESFPLTTHAPDLAHDAQGESESVGNHDGRPQPGETVSYTLQVRNGGTGVARGVTATLRSLDGFATVFDSTAAFGDIAPGATATGDVVTFRPDSANARFQLTVADLYGVQLVQTLDLTFPATPISLFGVGQATSIQLTWAHNLEPDLLGYGVYRSTSAGGPFARVNPIPTGRTSYYLDESLSPLTRYFYRVTAVDSSGNESAPSAVASASTNPPLHTIFPITTGTTTPSSVALEHVYSQQSMDIAAGSDRFYVIHADGTAPVDADGSSQTIGDFSLRGGYFPAGPSVAELVPGQGWSFVAPSWDSSACYVFDTRGNLRPGWPVYVSDAIWSSAAIGDLDGDGSQELVFGSNGRNIYALHANGSEVLDGDSNPSTKGIFKVIPVSGNFGTPALADLDGDGHPEIVYGGADGKVYAWKANGANVPGFPVVAGAAISASVAVGYLDGPGDPSPEIVSISTNDSLYVFEANGQRRPGFPVHLISSGNSRSPSPALADMNNDGFLDIVAQSTNGRIYVYDRNAALVPPWTGVPYSTLTGGASESSPVVADINGDGWNDVICGDENSQLSALSGANGQLLPGFPIQLGGEVRGTPAVADIDGDGMSEIVLAGWDKNIYVWDYDFPFQPGGTPPWPQFHHDARRTGFASAPLTLGVGEPPAGGVRTLELEPPAPNPARGAARLAFAVPATLDGRGYELAIYDLSGRRVRLVDRGTARVGRVSLAWDLRDEQRRPVAGGVYFERLTVGTARLTRKLVVLE